MTVSVVVADDHSIVREGLRAIISSEDDLDIVAETSDGLETVAVVEEVSPDVLVVDLVMPSLPGLEVITRVRNQSPDTRMVVLSIHADEAYVLRALRNGALGYVVKSAGAQELVKAIRAATLGRHYLSTPLSQDILKTYDSGSETDELDPYESLSLREREVLHLSGDGLTSSEIGDRLDISRRTVEAHRANLTRKIRVSSHAALIRYAISKQNLSPDL